eukprot:4216580-Amphidinium_carterae.1
MNMRFAAISDHFANERGAIQAELAEVAKERDWRSHEAFTSGQELLAEQAEVCRLHQVQEWETQSALQVKSAVARQTDGARELQDSNFQLRRLLLAASEENEEVCAAFGIKLAFLEETAASWCSRAEWQRNLASSVASKVLGLEAGAEESAVLWQRAERATEESANLRQRLHKQRQLGDAALQVEERKARDAAEIAAQAQYVEAEVVGKALVEVREQAYQKASAMRRADDAAYSTQQAQHQMDLQAQSVRALRMTTETRNWDAASLDTLLDGARAILEGAPDGDPATLDALLLQTSISAAPSHSDRQVRNASSSKSQGATEATLLRAQAEQLRSQLQHWNITREPLSNSR